MRSATLCRLDVVDPVHGTVAGVDRALFREHAHALDRADTIRRTPRTATSEPHRRSGGAARNGGAVVPTQFEAARAAAGVARFAKDDAAVHPGVSSVRAPAAHDAIAIHDGHRARDPERFVADSGAPAPDRRSSWSGRNVRSRPAAPSCRVTLPLSILTCAALRRRAIIMRGRSWCGSFVDQLRQVVQRGLRPHQRELRHDLLFIVMSLSLRARATSPRRCSG